MSEARTVAVADSAVGDCCNATGTAVFCVAVRVDATGLDVRVVDDPLSCVARGTSVYLENLSEWKDTLESDEDER